MTSTKEHDIVLTRLVAHLRRLARRVDQDPSAHVPRDPTVALASLGVPVEALLHFNPLERLRSSSLPSPLGSESSPAAPDAAPRGLAAPSARLPSVWSAPTGPAPRAPVPTRKSGELAAPEERTADAATAAARSPRPSPPTKEGLSELPEARSKAVATLAERRAAVRRGSGPRSPTASATRLPFSQAASATHTASATRTASAAQVHRPDVPAHDADSPAPGLRVVDSPSARAADRRGRREPQGALPAELPIRSSRLDPRRSARSTGTRTPPRGEETGLKETGLHELEPSQGAPPTTPGNVALGASPAGRGPRDVNAALGFANALGSMNAASGPQPSLAPQTGDRNAGAARFDGLRATHGPEESELTDELFEALYRGGVDLSWP